jgi:hypothetical protein
MAWQVRFHDAAKLLQDRSWDVRMADTLNGSQFSNMKELRFKAAGGVWRVAFAFDPNREGVLLVAGDKSGGSEDRFYKRLIAKADERYAGHLAAMKNPSAKKR